MPTNSYLTSTLRRLTATVFVVGALTPIAAIRSAAQVPAASVGTPNFQNYCTSHGYDKARTIRSAIGRLAADANWVCQSGWRVALVKMDAACSEQEHATRLVEVVRW